MRRSNSSTFVSDKHLTQNKILFILSEFHTFQMIIYARGNVDGNDRSLKEYEIRRLKHWAINYNYYLQKNQYLPIINNRYSNKSFLSRNFANYYADVSSG